MGNTIFVDNSGQGRGSYTTVAGAIAAASEGDLIAIYPGTYTESLTVTDGLSFLGLTDDPMTEVVNIHSAAGGDPCMLVNYQPGAEISMYIEGIKFTKPNTSWTRCVSVTGNTNLNFYFNRCWSIAGSEQYPIGFADTALKTLEIKNCNLDRGYAHVVNADWTGTTSGTIIKTQLDNTYNCFSCTGSPDINDYVTTGTVDYGPSYGTYYSTAITYLFTGYVYEQATPVVRQLYLHNRETGALKDETTSSGAGGYYEMTTTWSGAHYIVCLDGAGGTSYNDLILGNVYPTVISGSA